MLKRLAFSIFVSLVVLSAAVADDSKPAPKRPAGPKIIVKSDHKLTNRVLFIVDVSGSMRGDKFERAFNWIIHRVMTETDEMQFGIIAFDGDTYRWPGVPEPDADPEPVPPNWALLPSAIATQQAAEWLRKNFHGGGTEILPALKEAFAEKREKLSIVIVSDGEFSEDLVADDHEEGPGLAVIVRQLRKAREDAGFEAPMIFCYGTSVTPSEQMTWLAEVTEGLYMLDTDVREAVGLGGMRFHGMPWPPAPQPKPQPPKPLPPAPIPDDDPPDLFNPPPDDDKSAPTPGPKKQPDPPDFPW